MPEIIMIEPVTYVIAGSVSVGFGIFVYTVRRWIKLGGHYNTMEEAEDVADNIYGGSE